MEFSKKLIKYISHYGFLYVLKVIIKEYFYRPLNSLFVQIGKIIFRKSKLKNTIIIESHNDFDTNGGAFYEYLIKCGINKTYKIIWLIKNSTPPNLPFNVQCFNIFKPSIRKTYHICTAKFLLADDIITNKVRENQQSFYLTHGGSIGFKKCNVPLPDSIDHILMPSEDFAPYALENFKVPYPSDRLIYVGYPEQDNFYDNEIGKQEIKKIIKDKSYTKYIVWMPTFRKGGGAFRNDSAVEQALGIPLINDINEFERLNKFLWERNVLLIIKIHPMQYIYDLGIDDRSNIVVLTKDRMKQLHLDNYKMLSATDALISDYSTIAVEYFHMHKPIAFVLNDLNVYVGFQSEKTKELLVGNKIYTLEDMMAFIQQVFEGYDEFGAERENLFSRTHKYHDGNSCQRLAQYMGFESENDNR